MVLTVRFGINGKVKMVNGKARDDSQGVTLLLYCEFEKQEREFRFLLNATYTPEHYQKHELLCQD